jgi:hypothetical protein
LRTTRRCARHHSLGRPSANGFDLRHDRAQCSGHLQRMT